MVDKWHEQLENKIATAFGSKAKTVWNKYHKAFTVCYREQNQVSQTIADINEIEKLSSENQLLINLYKTKEKRNPLHLKLYQYQYPIALSDILPLLENMGLRTVRERSYEIFAQDQHSSWINDFIITDRKSVV